jgi:excinuclease ABC subunit B
VEADVSDFELVSPFEAKGDQPQAIDKLSRALRNGANRSVLLGVTGSGKTFTMGKVIEALNRPTLVIAPNKTLAAQLYQEFKGLFPGNAVEYFVSYYDYYQPEAYIPSSDTYIEKDSSINEIIDKLRHSATMSVLTRRDVLVVASVSCIFGLGAPEDYLSMRVELETGMTLNREKLLHDLVAMQYERNDIDFHRGVFRVRGDRVEILPAYEEERALRVDFFGDELEGVWWIDPLKGTVINRIHRTAIFPASHYVTQKTTQRRAVGTILAELKERVAHFNDNRQLIEAQRIEERTRFDMEMMQELGYCNGIENYSRHLTGRAAGQPPPTLLDYFPEDFLFFVDESHMAVPQLRAMYRGDRSRKMTLVEHGFRLPSALDNRPLKFEEVEERMRQVVFVSATPSEYELEQSRASVVNLIVRPTGLLDPVIVQRPAATQVDDLYAEIVKRVRQNERVLVTTLTKRMAEDLTDYFTDLNLNVRYLHSDVSTLERMDIIHDLRIGKFDVLIGINLLREGLDLPEVSLVAILDADKEGFLRSARALIQTFGRAARNLNGTVLLYADRTTNSMRAAMAETERRRKKQAEFNRIHGIVPQSIQKAVTTIFDMEPNRGNSNGGAFEVAEQRAVYHRIEDIETTISDLESLMQAAADDLDFETAAKYRDKIKRLQQKILLNA